MNIHLPHDTTATPTMPVLFIGHGSPMHAIEESAFSRAWQEMGSSLPAPRAILVISAHWMTRGTSLVHIGARPRTIHDFGGFPRALHEMHYPAPGAPDLAAETLELLHAHHAEADVEWGLDHGAWCILSRLFPKADVPVYQLSLDLSRPLADHLTLARDLRRLRKRGVLIVGSGNIVHNLMATRHGATPYEWAAEFDDLVATAITDRAHGRLAEFSPGDPLFRACHPTLEHYLPLLYSLGATEGGDKPEFFTQGIESGALSMRSVIFRPEAP